jgi:hypothetical protein
VLVLEIVAWRTWLLGVLMERLWLALFCQVLDL